MSTLLLQQQDFAKIRQSWSDIQANKRYHKDDFASRLFNNLLASSPDLKSVLSNDMIIRQQTKLFNEMLGFTIMYLDDLKSLDECMVEFIHENPSIVSIGVKYLEPMGIALIQTFRQWLGNGKFHAGLETLWIKVYIYLANCILQNDDEGSDIDSIYSKNSLKESSETEVEDHTQEEYEPIKPLKPAASKADLKVPEPQPLPTNISSNSLLQAQNTIHIELSSNAKYKGFRRSVNTPKLQPIEVKIPEALSTSSFISSLPSPQTVSQPFDPRRSRGGSNSPSIKEEESEEEPEYELTSPPVLPAKDFDPRSRKRLPSISTATSSAAASVFSEEFGEPMITPRSSRRTPSLPINECPDTPTKGFESRKLQVTTPSKVISDDSDVEFDNEKEKGFGFDPRRKVSSNSYKDQVKEEVVSEVENDTYDLNDQTLTQDDSDDQIDFSETQFAETDLQASAKLQVFDSNSFGIQGLAPIVEDSDDGSSHYDSENEHDSSSNYDAGGESSIDKSTGDEVSSSGASSLSLHNSDYRSSISSGNESAAINSPCMNKFQMGHQSKASNISDISYMKPLAVPATPQRSLYNKSYASSTPALSSPQRASLGFMRSSFVLKKELEEVGFNHPENVLMKPPTIPAAMGLSAHSNGTSDSLSIDSKDVGKVSARPPPPTMLLNKTYSKSTSNIASETDFKPLPLVHGKKEKMSFRKRLSSLFGSPSTPAKLPVSKKPITSSVGTPQKFDVASFGASSYTSNTPSKAPKMDIPTSASSMMKPTPLTSMKPQPRTPQQPSYPSSIRSYKPSAQRKLAGSLVSDLASIKSTETGRSSISGFSFFNHKRASAPKKAKQKYNVQSVPYDIFAKN